MVLILLKGTTVVIGPAGFDVVTTEVTRHGLTYSDIAVVTVTESPKSGEALYEIADKLDVDIRITIKKKKKKFLGIF